MKRGDVYLNTAWAKKELVVFVCKCLLSMGKQSEWVSITRKAYIRPPGRECVRDLAVIRPTHPELDESGFSVPEAIG